MATGLSAGAANDLMDALATDYTWVQLHTAEPGAAGTTEVADESTRQQVTWTAASNGAVSNNNELSWTSVAGTEDYTHFSVWSAETSGDFGFSGTVTANSVTIGDTFQIPQSDLTASIPTAS